MACAARGRRPSAEEAPRRHGLCFSLQGQLADRFEFERVVRERLRQLAHICLAGRGGRLEPLREDHGIAEHGVVHACLTAEDAGDTVARVDADMQRELGLIGQLAAEPLHFRVHLERDDQGTRSVVLVRDRSPEEREESIACKFVHVPLVTGNDPALPGDHGVDYLQELLRVETISERRKAGDVGKESGDQTPLFGNLTPRLDEALRNLARNEAAEGFGNVLVSLRLGRRRRRR